MFAFSLSVQSHTVPKLPPIRRRGKSLPSTSFYVPTTGELRQLQRHRDKRERVQHSESNPRCVCQLCAAGGATAGETNTFSSPPRFSENKQFFLVAQVGEYKPVSYTSVYIYFVETTE